MPALSKLTCGILVIGGLVSTGGLRAGPDESPSGQADAAKPETQSADPAEFDRLARQANQAREADRVPQAIELYQQALRLRPAWEEGWWYLGTLLYSSDHASQALDAFRHLAETQPKKGAPWAMIGLCEFDSRDYERALQDLLKARSLGLGEDKRLTVVTRYHTAILLTRFDRAEEGFEVLKEFAEDQNDDPSVIEAMGISTLALPYLPSELPSDKHDLVLMAGRAAYPSAARHEDEAERLFGELLARYPETPNVHYSYGYFLLPDHPDQALEEFRREIRISPSHLLARMRLAAEYLRRNDEKAALPFAAQAVQLAPELFRARYFLGRALLGIGETGQAIQELEIARKLAPEEAQVHFALARAYARAGRTQEAAHERAEFARLDRLQRAQQEGPQSVGGSPARPAPPH